MPFPARIVRFLVLILLLSHAANVQAADEPKKFAFVVGINTYQKRSFPDLKYSERDAEALAGALRGMNFKVGLLLGSAKGELKATRHNIDTQLKKLLKLVGKQDLLVVALSGHGAQFESRQADGTTKDDAYFCPFEAVANDPQTLFSLSYLIDDLLTHQGGMNLVLVDACRNVPSDPSKGSKGVQGKSIKLPENTAVFFSCKAGQQSFENDEAGGGHSVFTYCVLEGLRGEAAKAGEITWTGLSNHVEDRMASAEVRKWIPAGREQIPLATGNIPRTVLGRLPSNGAAAEGQRAGDERSDNGLNTKLVWCPKGSFKMGSPKSEEGRSKDEDQVNVKLTKGFWLGKFEVTQGEWEKVMGTTPWKGEKYMDNAKEGAKYPTYVSWEDAVAFCEKLTRQERAAGRLPEGWKYTLPTEAQWEYACRAGTTTRYSFGNDEAALSEYAWWGGVFGDGNAKNEKYAHQVGTRKGNPWGLHDMHGNVWEWCQDIKVDNLPGGTDPEVTSGGSDRVSRGGGWINFAVNYRSAGRSGFSPRLRGGDLGFRLARSPIQ